MDIDSMAYISTREVARTGRNSPSWLSSLEENAVNHKSNHYYNYL